MDDGGPQRTEHKIRNMGSWSSWDDSSYDGQEPEIDPVFDAAQGIMGGNYAFGAGTSGLQSGVGHYNLDDKGYGFGSLYVNPSVRANATSVSTFYQTVMNKSNLYGGLWANGQAQYYGSDAEVYAHAISTIREQNLWYTLANHRSLPSQRESGTQSGDLIVSSSKSLDLIITSGVTSKLKIVYASSSWDWFIEITKWTSDGQQYSLIIAALIYYNTDANEQGQIDGVVTDIIIRGQQYNLSGGINQPSTDQVEISDNMSSLIKLAIDYHCGGCNSQKSVNSKFWDFISSSNSDDVNKNRLSSGAPHR